MADFSKVDWFAVMKVIGDVEAEVKALQDATDTASKGKAIGDLAQTIISAAEAFSGKDLVNNDAVAAVVGDLVHLIVDLENVK